MKTDALSIKILYWLTNIILGLLSLVIFGAILINILVHSDYYKGSLQLQVQLPIEVSFTETGVLHLNDQDIAVDLIEAYSKIHFNSTPAFISRKVAFFLLLVVSLLSYFLWVFRLFVKNVKNAIVFTRKNISHIKKMSYILLGFWILFIAYGRFTYYYIVNNMHFENIEFTSDYRNYTGILLAALLLWAIAHIFGVGLKLKQENELTI